MYTPEEDRLTKRAGRISEWLDYVEAMYSDLLSRRSETASRSGFDPRPSLRPCEHRIEWRQGRLCLACDNTGWRQATSKERAEGMGIDPYAADLPKHKTVLVESAGVKKAREGRHIDHVISQLERDAQVRAGLEAVEGSQTRVFRSVTTKKTPTLDRILHTLNHLRENDEVIYESLDRSQLCDLLARLVPGPIEEPAWL